MFSNIYINTIKQRTKCIAVPFYSPLGRVSDNHLTEIREAYKLSYRVRRFIHIVSDIQVFKNDELVIYNRNVL